jgi:twitching motility protein PilT
VIARLAEEPRGLVLVTGPTGSGKTTTLASLLDLANRTRTSHIVTIEDPIEFLHQHKRCLVNQREVGTDTESFATALKHALRQDPDIKVLVTTCTGASTEKWNAPPSVLQSVPLKDIAER